MTTNEPVSRAQTILLVEDENSLLRLLSRKLTGLGYVVLAAANAEDALVIDAGHSGTIDLLISDVMLPKLSGPALAQRLMPRRPAMRVLFISGYAAEANERLRQMPNAQLLLKPFKIDEFLTATQRALIGRSAHKPPSTDPWG